MSDVSDEVRRKSLELARYCTGEVSTLAKQGCIAVAIVEAEEAERVRVRALVRDFASGAFMDAQVPDMPSCCARERIDFWEEWAALLLALGEPAKDIEEARAELKAPRVR